MAPAVQPGQEPQTARLVTEATTSQGLVDTAGKVRLWLNGALGFGFANVDVGVTTGGETVSLRGGGGIGLGAGAGYGLSRKFDLDVDLGFQLSGESPAVDNATASFGRGFLLATIKYKIPTSDSGQFKLGLGVGEYFGGKLDVDTRSGAFGHHDIVKYNSATGFHCTGEFERFLRPNLSFSLGAKVYFVKYKADSYTRNDLELPVSTLPDKERNLDGSGMDVMISLSTYF